MVNNFDEIDEDWPIWLFHCILKKYVFLDPEVTFVNIKEVFGAYIIETRPDRGFAKFFVDSTSYPAASLVWHDNQDNIIPFSSNEDDNHKLEAYISSTISNYVIVNSVVK